jgi:hypothetical protein
VLFDYIGLLDNVFKVVLEKVLTYCAAVPVTVESILIEYVDGKIIINGIRILVPPVDEDDRWENECIIEVKQVTGKVDFGSLIYWLVASKFSLLVFHGVQIRGVKVCVEGFVDCKSGTTFYNVWLLGALPEEPAGPPTPTEFDQEYIEGEEVAGAKAFFGNTYKTPSTPSTSSQTLKEIIVDADTSTKIEAESAEPSAFDQRVGHLKATMSSYYAMVSFVKQLMLG